jgi:hypothetical protein
MFDQSHRSAHLASSLRWALLLTSATLTGSACGKQRLAGQGTGDPGGAAPGGAGQGGAPGFVLPPPAAAGAVDAAPPPPAGETCAAEIKQAGRLPVDLLFVVDKSTSMNLEIAPAVTQWDLVREALIKFVRDPRSAELGAGLQLFPLVPRDILVCSQDTDCVPETCDPPRFGCSGTGRPCAAAGQPCNLAIPGDVCAAVPRICRSRGFAQCDGRYDDPAVPVAVLPGAAEPFATRLVYTRPEGMTPIEPAVRGGLAHLRARLGTPAGTGRKAALVLVTDGFPVGCSMSIPEIAAIAGESFQASPSIPTFVIGVFSGDGGRAQMIFDELAQGGGTDKAILVEPNADLSAKLLAALETIREAVLPCAFTIPAPRSGALDYGRVNLSWKSAGAGEDVLYVERAERCDPARGGWYYDVPPAQGTPGQVLVCPATCERFKTQQAATVELTFGCQTRRID